MHERIIQSALETFGKIDILVNNAGIAIGDNLFSIEEKGFDQTINTNLRSVIFLTKACIPHLIESKGVIINVSSLFATTSSQQDRLSYSISKAALDQFTKCISLGIELKNESFIK